MATGIERARRLFTVDEYDRMAMGGVFRPEDRVELIEGEIVEMTPIGPPHSACVAALTRILTLGIAERGIVWVQSPVAIPAYSKPQPTWPWSARARTAQRIRRPTTSCCSSRSPIRRYATDRTIKRDVYARAGIHECWIVDTATETVEVFRSPTAAGYGEARRVARDGTIAPSAFPDVTVRVPELFT